MYSFKLKSNLKNIIEINISKQIENDKMINLLNIIPKKCR